MIGAEPPVSQHALMACIRITLLLFMPTAYHTRAKILKVTSCNTQRSVPFNARAATENGKISKCHRIILLLLLLLLLLLFSFAEPIASSKHSSPQCDLLLPLPTARNFSFPQGHPVTA
jgi:hypothetical protein